MAHLRSTPATLQDSPDVPCTNVGPFSTSHRAAHAETRTNTAQLAHATAWCNSTVAWLSRLRSCPIPDRRSWSVRSNRHASHTSNQWNSAKTASSRCDWAESNSNVCAFADIRMVAAKTKHQNAVTKTSSNRINPLIRFKLPSNRDPSPNADRMTFRPFSVCAKTPSHRDRSYRTGNLHWAHPHSWARDWAMRPETTMSDAPPSRNYS